MVSGDRIIHYDFNDINHSSFFLNGFLESSHANRYRFTVSRAVPDLLRGRANDKEWQKNLFAISLFKAEIGDDQFFFCIDTHDSSIGEAGYNFPLLEKVKYYFKVNYRSSVVDEDPALRRYADKIIPTTPYFPLKLSRSAMFLPRIMPNGDVSWSFQNARSRIKRLRTLVPLEELKALRDKPKDIDVFFVVAYYRQKHHSDITKTRYEIVERLSESSKINAITGLISNNPLPSELAHLHIERFDQATYFDYMARSKVAVYVRGPHDCLSFKFGELLALGKPIVGQKILNNASTLYRHPNFSAQFAFESAESIVGEIENLLERPDMIAELQRSNANVFDCCLTPQISVGDIVAYLYAPNESTSL